MTNKDSKFQWVGLVIIGAGFFWAAVFAVVIAG